MTPTVAQNPDNINNYLDDVLAIIGNPVHQAMRERMTSKWVYSILRRHPRNRPDLGMAKAVLHTVLDPANPFDSRVRRAPRCWFVFFILVGGTLLGCLVYFNDLI
jgi:hypothetical protein